MIAGATATGKTGLALALAERIGPAEIVSADSRQVYRGMDIGTAKVTVAERARVPHHGLDLVDPDEPFTAADFRAHALEALAGIAARRRLAILVGGTGLYLRVVGRGIPVDEAGHDPALRAALEHRLGSDGLPSLVAELRARTPGIAAATDLANPRRVLRALERAILGGDRPPPAPMGYPAPSAWIGLVPERGAHDRAIEARARAQLTGGLLEETAALRARYPDTIRSFSAMGYREAMGVLDGRLTLEAAIAEDAARTRAYARRQATWFRAEPGIRWLPGEGGALEAAAELAARLLDATGASGASNP